MLDRIKLFIAEVRHQRTIDRIKLKAQRDLAADVAKRKAAWNTEDYRRRRAAAMRGRGVRRLRGMA